MATRPLHPCGTCASVRFAHVPSLQILVPFLTSASLEKLAYKRTGRSGDALVCLGCGHIDYFMQSTDTLLMQSGVTEVLAQGDGPYR